MRNNRLYTIHDFLKNECKIEEFMKRAKIQEQAEKPKTRKT